MGGKLKIGVTMGDPAGIGPEIVMQACADADLQSKCNPIVIGNREIIEKVMSAAGISIRIHEINDAGDAAEMPGAINLINVDTDGIADIKPGVICAEGGIAADAYIRKSCELATSGKIDAVATSPINKESLRAAKISHIGHTEMYAAYLDSPDPLTLFVTENMRIFFLSRHLSLRQAIDFINADRVYTFIKRVYAEMSAFGFDNVRIGLAALNPHASDGGQFGDEEERFLVPAARKAQADGINVSLPIGADSVFNMALEDRFDCVISLYHDQGHIAAKTRDFHGTVTATLGMPVLRTSVDHGTAFDIAWNGVAKWGSMKSAILAAVDMLGRRKQQ